jgi:hypothetical protein
MGARLKVISTKIKPTTRLDFLAGLAMDARLNAVAVRIGIILLWHRNGQTGLICPSHQTLAAEAGCSVDTVKRSIAALAKAGWFRVIHQGKNGKQTVNRYVPNWEVGGAPMHWGECTGALAGGASMPPEGGHPCTTELDFLAGNQDGVEAGETKSAHQSRAETVDRQEPKAPANNGTPAAAGGFTEFYNAYPRKGDKKAAEAAYDRLIASGEISHRRLMQAVAKYDASRQGEQRNWFNNAGNWIDNGGGGYRSWGVSTASLKARIAAIKDIGDWRLHDLRRSCRTGLGKLGVPPHIAELVIGHVKKGVEAIYDRHKYQDEIALALTRWADHVFVVVERA